MTTIIIDRSFAGALDFRSISFVLNERSVCDVHPEKLFLPFSQDNNNWDILRGRMPLSHNESYVFHVELERSPPQNQRGSNKSNFSMDDYLLSSECHP